MSVVFRQPFRPPPRVQPVAAVLLSRPVSSIPTLSAATVINVTATQATPRVTVTF